MSDALAANTATKQRGRPFKKGQTGNPNGRPRKTQDIREIEALAKDLAPEAMGRLAEWMRSDNPKASVTACNTIIDRGYGKAKQALEHSGPDGGAIPLQFIELRAVEPK
jgi:hypothetical protein